MHGTRTAEGDHGVAPRIVPFLGDIHPRRRGHVLVDDGVDAGGGLCDVQPERTRDPGPHGVADGGEVERHVAAQKKSGER